MQIIDATKPTPTAGELLVKMLLALEHIQLMGTSSNTKFGAVHGHPLFFTGSGDGQSSSLVVLQNNGDITLINRQASNAQARKISAQRCIHLIVSAYGGDLDAATDHMLDVLYCTVPKRSMEHLQMFLSGLFGRPVPACKGKAS